MTISKHIRAVRLGGTEAGLEKPMFRVYCDNAIREYLSLTVEKFLDNQS